MKTTELVTIIFIIQIIIFLAMQTITREQAQLSAYQSLTTDIHTKREADIIESIEASMQGCDSVWISTGASSVQLARRASDIIRNTGGSDE